MDRNNQYTEETRKEHEYLIKDNEPEESRRTEKPTHRDEDKNKIEDGEVRRYAGFWMRFWAYLLDLFIVFSLNGLLLSPFMFTEDASVTIAGFFTLQGLLSILTSYLYFLLMTKWLGQTLGKMVIGIKVIKKDAGPLTWSDLFFREIVGRFIHRSLYFTNIIYIVVGVTKEKQGVHDMFADTRVIHVQK